MHFSTIVKFGRKRLYLEILAASALSISIPASLGPGWAQSGPGPARVTEAVKIPTIGIGAGPHCDGQVLVGHDLLGLFSDFQPRFVKRYANLADVVRAAVRSYCDEVQAGAFPDAEHSFR